VSIAALELERRRDLEALAQQQQPAAADADDDRHVAAVCLDRGAEACFFARWSVRGLTRMRRRST
jgi:hypothetical protein